MASSAIETVSSEVPAKKRQPPTPSKMRKKQTQTFTGTLRRHGDILIYSDKHSGRIYVTYHPVSSQFNTTICFRCENASLSMTTRLIIAHSRTQPRLCITNQRSRKHHTSKKTQNAFIIQQTEQVCRTVILTIRLKLTFRKITIKNVVVYE